MEQDTNRLKNDALQLKQRVGKAVVDDMVKSGMKLGLGTGSTAIHAVRRIGELMAQGTLRDISVFATSLQTEIECENLNIPCYTLNSRKLSSGLDLTIDGADEVDPNNYLIKGGGGALLIEKIAAYASTQFAVIVDDSKLTEKRLGSGFLIPVETVQAARALVTKALEKLGAAVILREAVRKAGPVITEHGNVILDIKLETGSFAVNAQLKQRAQLEQRAQSQEFKDTSLLESELNQIPGVAANGLFTKKPPVVYIAHSDGTIETRGKK